MLHKKRKNVKRLILWLAFTTVVIVAAFACASLEARVVNVERVIEGDTIVLTGGEKVRLLGVDTPEQHDPDERKRCFANQALLFTQSRIRGKAVKLTSERPFKDKFGMTLAWVWYGPEFTLLLNADIVRKGYGVSFKEYSTSRLEEFNRLEQEAGEAKRGLWNPHACKLDSPQPAPPGDKDETVYITKRGCCYHKKNCGTLKRSKKIEEVKKSVAVKRGKRACKICKP